MSRVLLLATTTGYQTRAFETAAARRGVQLVYATDRCDRLDDPWSDRAIAIRFHEPAASVEAVLRAAESDPIDAVLAVGDRPATLAALIAEALHLPGHPHGAAVAASHKRLTRQRLRDAGLPVPWFHDVAVTSDLDDLDFSVAFPCVLKPVALSGSRGVMRADDRVTLAAALDRLRRLLRAPDVQAERNPDHGRALIEGFVEGREFAIECLMTSGRLQVLAIFDKPDPLDGPFFEETIYVAPSSADGPTQAAIVAGVEKAVRAIGLVHGPVHAECRVNPAGVFVLETAARPIGGLCARALTFERDGDVASLEELLLLHALGEDVSGWQREPPASGVMMIPIPRAGFFRGARQVDAARSVPGVTEIQMTAKIDQRLVPLPEGASYLGFIFARSPAGSGVEKALRDAHARLVIDVDPELRVIESTHG
ncbi:MAG: ATP-grasp domain-containing protein [Vicinamibacterales bacterium]